MESSLRSSTTYRFRDHSEPEIAIRSDTDSNFSSVSSDLPADDDDDLDSMTGKGIKHLCSELQELKLASDEEFHRNIFANYTVFIRMFKEAKSLENQVEQLKKHISTQNVLVKELVDIGCSEALSEKGMDLIIEEFELDESWCSSELEDHLKKVSDILDVLLLENRIEEALNMIDLAEENFQNIQFEDSYSLDDLRFYSSVISERKADLSIKLTQLAENPRIAAPELQKALLGLCRLGESDRATQLMLNYYDARIASGIRNLQRTRSLLGDVYIRELSKLVFSLISQAARSFVVLDEEGSRYETELIEWAKEETRVYVDCFNQYLKSAPELSGGLAMAVQAVQVSMSVCSLFKTHRLVLRPYLVKHIGPGMEEILLANLEHFKDVVGVFSASDSWILRKYLVSEITNEGCEVVGQETECCMLTSSGQELARLVKTITEDVAPLFGLQMEGLFFDGLINLFKEYVLTLEKALFYDSDVTKKDGSRINLSVSLQQQISILANLSALEQILPRMVRHIYGESQNISSYIHEHVIDYQQKEIDNYKLFAQEASSRIRSLFCQKYVTRIMSLETSCKLTLETDNNVQDIATAVSVAMPSVTFQFQTLFLELRKIERLAEGYGFDKEWLLEILRELVETTFDWISNNKDMWTTSDENATQGNSFTYNQFVLDLQFLVQITKYGRYFSNHPSGPENLMNSAFRSAGFISESSENTPDHFDEVIRKLLEIEKATILPNEEPANVAVNETIAAANYFQEDVAYFSDNSKNSGDDLRITTTITEKHPPSEEYSSPQGDSQGNSSDGDADDDADTN